MFSKILQSPLKDSEGLPTYCLVEIPLNALFFFTATNLNMFVRLNQGNNQHYTGNNRTHQC